MTVDVPPPPPPPGCFKLCEAEPCTFERSGVATKHAAGEANSAAPREDSQQAKTPVHGSVRCCGTGCDEPHSPQQGPLVFVGRYQQTSMVGDRLWGLLPVASTAVRSKRRVSDVSGMLNDLLKPRIVHTIEVRYGKLAFVCLLLHCDVVAVPDRTTRGSKDMVRRRADR